MTDTEKIQYVLPSLDDLTLNDAFAIKVATRVDILRPPTVAHGDAALLWFVSKDTEQPLKYEDLVKLPLGALSDYIADEEPEPEDNTAADAAAEPVTTPLAEDDNGPKASETSQPNSSVSDVPGLPHLPS